MMMRSAVFVGLFSADRLPQEDISIIVFCGHRLIEMLKILLILVVAYILFEFTEHVIFPLYWLITKKQRRSPTGESGMIGQIAEVKEWEGNKGRVFVHGELWNAQSDVPLSPGDEVAIQSVERLTLTVKRSEE
jgi:membrane-bound ClpP family serine protease